MATLLFRSNGCCRVRVPITSDTTILEDIIVVAALVVTIRTGQATILAEEATVPTHEATILEATTPIEDPFDREALALPLAIDFVLLCDLL